MEDNSYWSDKRISWKAKGLLTYLLHCNEQATIKDLIFISKDKVTSVYSGLDELKNAGYLQRLQVKNELGRYKSYENILIKQNQDMKNKT